MKVVGGHLNFIENLYVQVVNVIKVNAHKYSVSAMCKVLQVSRSAYYYEAKQKADEVILTTAINDIYKASHNNYGTRKTINHEYQKTKFLRFCREECCFIN